MENQNGKKTALDTDVQVRFDQILCRHVKRLTGEQHGIEGVRVNTVFVACIMLLMERHKEIENQLCDPSEGYSENGLLAELAQMGLTGIPDSGLDLSDLIQRGFFRVDPNGVLTPGKPAESAAQLLNKLFQGMPDMNLVAYFIQTMAEVKSGRKALENAADQFDETLQMKGVSLI